MEKQMKLDQAPLVAALHLKRFKIFLTHTENIEKHVDFPLELDLGPYINASIFSSLTQEHLKYQLYAVVMHVGSSSNSGHYFCYVRSSPSIWHKLDDSKVTKVAEKEVYLQLRTYYCIGEMVFHFDGKTGGFEYNIQVRLGPYGIKWMI